MKILLVVPQYYSRKERYYQMPLGLAYVNAALREANLDVQCLNMNHIEAEDAYSVLAERVVNSNIDVVLCGGISPLWKTIKKVFDTVKRAKASIITVGGGGAFTSEPLISAELLEVDYAVIGEGEITDVELIQTLMANQNVSNVKGIVYKTPDGYRQTAPREEIADVDSIPFPCYEGFDMDLYLENQMVSDEYYSFYSDKPRIMPMILGRSCPYQCKFCFHPIGNKYRVRSLDNFFMELDQWKNKYAPTCILILDELFSASVERVYEFCERIKGYEIKWIVQMRVDIITKELLQTMRDAGCLSISYGLESFSPAVLKNMRKHISLADIENALKLTYEAKIDIQGNFIFGDELENEHTIYETLRFWFQHPEYKINLGWIETYPGCGYYRELSKNWSVEEKKAFLEMSEWLTNLTKMPDEEYGKYKVVIQLLTFYYNPDCVKEKERRTDENGDGIIEAKCVHCGSVNRWAGVKKYLLNQSYFKLCCRKCNHRNVIYSRKERLKNWDLILPLCEKMALATKEDEFIKAVNALYETYMVTHDPENPFPVLF